jgi:nicotinamidase/pyrazinamidase
VFVVGLARDYCVKATALDAAREGFDTVVIDDLTRAVAPDQAEAVDCAFAEGHVARVRAADLQLAMAAS